jgi:hypothetical protein
MDAKCRYDGLKMLTAASVIADCFERDKAIFIQGYSDFEDPFLDNFCNEINKALSKYYGINTKEELHKANLSTGVIDKDVIDDLSIIKDEIECVFRNKRQQRNNILSQLGFAAYWKKTYNQITMFKLLSHLHNQMNPDLKVLLITEGVNERRLNNVINVANRVHLADVFQNLLMDNSLIGSQHALNVAKNIYYTAMEICYKGQKLFKKNKEKKAFYIFSNVIAQQDTRTISSKVNTANDGITLSKSIEIANKAIRVLRHLFLLI